MGIIEALIEITILILPIREILRLQLSTKKKFLLALIFALGGFVIITAILRMAILYRPGQKNIDLTQGDIWLNVHLGTAIISACLPTYRPLLLRNPLWLQTFHSSQGAYPLDDTPTLPPDKKKKKKKRDSRSGRFMEEIYTEQQQDHPGSFVDARRSESISMAGMELQENGAVKSGAAIGVKHTIEVV